MDQNTLNQLAHKFMVGAVAVQQGQNIWVEHMGEGGLPLARACVDTVRSLGATAYVVDSGSQYLNSTIPGKSDDALKAIGEKTLAKMREMDGYIRIGDDAEISKLRFSQEDFQRYQKLVMQEATLHRIKHTNWLVTRAPTPEFAQACGMELVEFENFFTKTCLPDFSQKEPEVRPLVDLMGQQNTVHITGKNTSLRMRTIGGGKAQSCTGKHNIPDGEVFTAPVIHSVEGHIQFGPSNYNGQSFQSIYLVYEAGRIIKAEAESAERTQALNKILDSDDGARSVGEFAIAFNPHIDRLTGDILFDEKRKESLHLAQGQCYEDVANNGNKSSIHWDMVHVQSPEHGGGEIWFNDRLIRKDGSFVASELEGLNPENFAS